MRPNTAKPDIKQSTKGMVGVRDRSGDICLSDTLENDLRAIDRRPAADKYLRGKVDPKVNTTK